MLLIEIPGAGSARFFPNGRTCAIFWKLYFASRISKNCWIYVITYAPPRRGYGLAFIQEAASLTARAELQTAPMGRGILPAIIKKRKTAFSSIKTNYFIAKASSNLDNLFSNDSILSPCCFSKMFSILSNLLLTSAFFAVSSKPFWTIFAGSSIVIFFFAILFSSVFYIIIKQALVNLDTITRFCYHLLNVLHLLSLKEKAVRECMLEMENFSVKMELDSGSFTFCHKRRPDTTMVVTATNDGFDVKPGKRAFSIRNPDGSISVYRQ